MTVISSLISLPNFAIYCHGKRITPEFVELSSLCQLPDLRDSFLPTAVLVLRVISRQLVHKPREESLVVVSSIRSGEKEPSTFDFLRTSLSSDSPAPTGLYPEDRWGVVITRGSAQQVAASMIRLRVNTREARRWRVMSREVMCSIMRLLELVFLRHAWAELGCKAYGTYN